MGGLTHLEPRSRYRSLEEDVWGPKQEVQFAGHQAKEGRPEEDTLRPPLESKQIPSYMKAQHQ